MPRRLCHRHQLVHSLNMADRVEVILCDGLAGVEDDMTDDIVIAGMGGDTIIHIMESWPHSRKENKHFLLQAMTKPEVLRGWLWQNGFDILEERCARQSGKHYSVMSVCYTVKVVNPAEWMLYLGAINDFDNPDARAYGQKLVSQLGQKVTGMETAGQDPTHWRKLMEEIAARMTTEEEEK